MQEQKIKNIAVYNRQQDEAPNFDLKMVSHLTYFLTL